MAELTLKTTADLGKKVNWLQLFRKISLNRLMRVSRESLRKFLTRLGRAAGRLPARVPALAARMPRTPDAWNAFWKNRLRAFRELEQEQRAQILRWAVSCVLMISVTVGSVATVMASARWADITVDGVDKPQIEIVSDKTGDILSLAGVKPGPNALVSRRQLDSGTVKITVKTAKHVTVAADGKQTAVSLHYGNTVSDALAQAGIVLDGNDTVSPSVQTTVCEGMVVRVLRRMDIVVLADGKTTVVQVNEGTVSQALVQAGVPVGADDTTSVSANAAVAEGMNIKIARVSYRSVTTTQAVPFQTVTRKDSGLTAGVKKVQTAGQNGVRTVVTKQKLCDGNPVENSVVSSTVTAQPVDQVVLVGTKTYREGAAMVGGAGTFVDRNGNTVSYRKVLTGRCTAYTGGGHTSTGRAAAYGLVAVNPAIIPYGTRLYICSPGGGVVYGYAVAADTGSAAMHNRILADLYYDTYSGCEQIGSRTMNVYVLN